MKRLPVHASVDCNWIFKLVNLSSSIGLVHITEKQKDLTEKNVGSFLKQS